MLESILSIQSLAPDITGMMDGLINNFVWICLFVAAFLVFLLGLAIFRGKRKWIWRAASIVVVSVVVLSVTNLGQFLSAYTDQESLGEASRFEIGNETPEIAKSIEHLIIGAQKVDGWSSAGFLVWEKVYTNDTGTATITRNLFTSKIEVRTNAVVWTAQNRFGKVDAQVEYIVQNDSP